MIRQESTTEEESRLADLAHAAIALAEATAETVEITYNSIPVRVHVRRLVDGGRIADPYIQAYHQGIWSVLYVDELFSARDIADILQVAVMPNRESDR